jgi:predicted nucleotidyltransferase
MQVTKADVICGLPASTARNLMRAYFDDRSAEVACEILGIDLDAAQDQLLAFEAAGFVRRTENKIAVLGERWVTTVKGNALAQASFGKPITRATAERHLGQVLARASAYNANPGYLLTVAEIAVFGSYLDPGADRLGDLDLAVTAVRRETDGDRHVSQVLDYAEASGRSFGTFVEQLFWPARELKMILKNRSPAISITNEDVSKLTSRFEIVYAVSSDPGAIQPPPDAMTER